MAKYPDIHVQLSGEDGNAMMIVGRVRKAMKRAGVTTEECDEFSREALSGTYNEVIQTCMKWVSVT